MVRARVKVRFRVCGNTIRVNNVTVKTNCFMNNRYLASVINCNTKLSSFSKNYHL